MQTQEDPTELKPPTRKYCRRKHELTPENIYYRPDGYPACRKCMLLADRRYHARDEGPHAE